MSAGGAPSWSASSATRTRCDDQMTMRRRIGLILRWFLEGAKTPPSRLDADLIRRQADGFGRVLTAALERLPEEPKGNS
jgi:hypothetical protein